MPDPITSLIEKLEAGPVYLTNKEAYDLAILFGSDTALGLAQIIRKAFAGASLDAALALAERVLPGWVWEITILQDETSVQGALEIWPEGLAAPDCGGVSISLRAPALALCAALLRAQSEARATGEDSPANEGEGF